MKKNYYQLLEIDETASSDEIKKSYRKLALKYHPDRNPPGDRYSETLFKQVVEAYAVLSKAHTKAEYDHYLLKKKNGSAHHHHGHRHSNSNVSDTATVTAKRTEVVTAASLLRQFNTIRRRINDVQDSARIKQDALYNELANLLSIHNINILRTGDQNFVRHVIESIQDSCKMLNHSYVQNLTPRLIKLAGSDSHLIKRIYRFNKKHRRKSNWEKKKPFIILGFVAAAIITYLVIAYLYSHGYRRR